MNLDQIPFNFSLIADEFSPSIEGQVAAAKRIGARAIDLRSIGVRNVAELSVQELDDAVGQIHDAGLVVAGLASSLGKHFGESQAMTSDLLRLHEVAERHRIPTIRIFGRLCAPSGSPGNRQALDWLEPLRTSIDRSSVGLVIEPEIGTGIPYAMEGLARVREFESEHLKLVWDSGNFVKQGCCAPVSEFYDALKVAIGHVHIKDFDTERQRPCPAGEGAGQIAQLLHRLWVDRYSGWVALEPQLVRDTRRFPSSDCALEAAAMGVVHCWTTAQMLQEAS
ncbi:sugar phosphate isomerase/epimerase [Pseudomonas sp. L13]|uniref:sugar phosphate isomerase/epimerase family protein n=1 Tax=Pseudomonas sp. L13 TaxID=343985 RepID=UPI00137A19D0|nr:TIM barrel protein [Pseudomonas sp. L13]NCE90229.1 hypothetical protein [Pseudomonas sp. L13]